LRDRAAGVMVAGLLCLATSWLPLHAATRTVELADGSSLTVWEQRGRALRGQETSSIGYRVSDASGTRMGLVEMTADAALDVAPYLAIDPTGAAVMVWSRFDGSYRKIAYMRYTGGAWTDFHYLTFGPRDDDDPRIGSDRGGSFLFYVAQPDTYMYAPLDLAAGRLFAAPRQLGFGSAHRDVSSPQRSPVTLSPRGSVDVPVTGVTPPDKRAGPAPSNAPLPGRLSPKGAVDVPVAQSRATSSVFWAVGSGGDCTGMVLVIPAANMKSAFVFRFVGGFTHLLKRVDLPPAVSEKIAETLATSELPLVCND
jgi:hypothetical protein